MKRIINPSSSDLNLLKEGDHIRFWGEIQKYTVQDRSDRYLICTKPFNLMKTVLYSVVDLHLNKRGVDNYGGLGYETKEECKDALKMWQSGDAEFSRRRPPIELRVAQIMIK